MKQVAETFDVIVIGAGAAGLACAEELIANDLSVCVLEAKATFGGRIHSAPDSHFPLELGAEFVHGVPSEILTRLSKYNLPFYDALDEHLFLQNGKLKKLNFFDRVGKITKRLNPKRKTDRSVRDFFEHLRAVDSESKKMFQSYVEGFQAADMDVIGERALAEAEETDDDDLNGSSLFRLPIPYLDLLKRILKPESLLLNTRVHKIQWNKGAVQLHCRQKESDLNLFCKRIVVTVPIGVLQASPADGGIEWDPVPRSLTESLSGVCMGHVQKMIFGFKSRFWENLSDDPISFLHTGPEYNFPTWWTLAPLRTPYLIAWQGGPRALEMATWSEPKRIRSALETLSHLTHRSLKWLEKEVVTVQSHNWTLDDCSLGAYSYVKTGGHAKARNLSHPIEETIFFAGEGTCMNSERGTVHGALASGAKAAKQILGERRSQ